MSDANKTELTKRVTQAVVSWLSERGFRPVESECAIERGWCADIAGFAYLTRTEAKRLNLMPNAPTWKPNAPGEWREQYDAWLHRLEGLPQPVTAAIEVKTSVQDFRRDGKFQRTPPTHLVFAAYPRNMIAPDAVDERWGILAFDEKDGKVKRIRKAPLHEPTIEQTLRVCCEIGLRRDNFTAYERLREFDRQAREHNNERENRHRIDCVIRMVAHIQSGKYTVDESLAMNLRRAKISRSAREQLEKLQPASCAVQVNGRH